MATSKKNKKIKNKNRMKISKCILKLEIPLVFFHQPPPQKKKKRKKKKPSKRSSRYTPAVSHPSEAEAEGVEGEVVQFHLRNPAGYIVLGRV